jgi:uncharacterized protein YbaP (TraB family)
MRLRRRRSWPVVLILAVVSPALADPPRPSFTRGEPLLWRVEQGRATSHLFGTCHLPIDLEKALRPAGLDALDHARRVFVELDMSSLMTLVDVFKTMMSRAQMPDRSLKALLSPPSWRRLVAVHQGYLGDEQLDHMKPWAVGFATYSRLAEKARTQRLKRGDFDLRRPILDAAVALRAKEHDIRVEALETPLQQVQIFNGQRLQDDVRALTDLLEHPDASDESVAMLDACAAFDERVLRKEAGRLVRQYPAFADRILTQRNRAWVERLQLWLPDGDMFVAVGAAHMFGDDGLVTLLRKRGYRVSRVRSVSPPAAG